MAFKTPALGTKGVFSLETPFTLSASVVYTVTAIRSFQELIAAGVDIYATYYQPNGLTQQAYQGDLTAGANLVTLQATGQPVVHVPDSYIANYPQLGNVPYSNVILAVSVGPVPDSLDLSFLKEQMGNVVQGVIGLQPTVNVFISPSTDVMTQAQADDAEAARQAAITLNTSDYARLQATLAQVSSQAARIAALEAIIVQLSQAGQTQSNQTPPPAS